MNEWRCQLKLKNVQISIADVEQVFEEALLRSCSGSGTDGKTTDIGWAYFTEDEARAVEREVVATCLQLQWDFDTQIYYTATS
ncbi:hypothetical protein LCGC14_2855750 [marine sediment metagenome]|uniref:Uncharacterized protein n=1 Tax=marine sediment metagenome TaxID=412755 RepID=A0A0F8YTU6_9ZZZZ